MEAEGGDWEKGRVDGREVAGMKEGEGNEWRQNESQCHQCWEERGVFDLTHPDSKTLELLLLPAESCHCTVLGRGIFQPPSFTSLLYHIIPRMKTLQRGSPKIKTVLMLITYN